MNSTTSEYDYEYETDPPAGTTGHDPEDNYDRNTDYAVNVLFVLGFLSSGDH